MIAALLTVSAGVVFVVVPRFVGQRIASKLEARTGLPAHVGGVGLGMTSVSIDELVLGGESGEFSLRARDIRVKGSPFRLAMQGSRAASSITVGGVDVRMPLQAKSSRTLIERVSARDGSDEGAPDVSAGRRERDVQIGQISVVLTDEHGELARVQNARVKLDAGRVQVAADQLALGQQPGGEFFVKRLALEAGRGSEGYALERASVGEAKVWLPSLPVDPSDGKPAVPRSLERLKKVLPRKSAEAVEPAPAADAAPPSQGSISRALARLADSAVLTLDTATVYGKAQGVPILQKLSASLKIQPGDVMLFTGSGIAQADGALRWDLVVRPKELRADGDVELRALPLSLLAPALPGIPWYRPEDARVDAALRIKTAPEGISFSGDGSLRGAAIESARIAPTPVRGIDVDLRGSGRLLPLQHRLEISSGEFSLSRATIHAQGAIEWSPDHYLFNIDATLPPTSCTEVVQSVPEDVLGDMALATWKGKLGGQLKLRLDSRQLEETDFTVKVQDHCQFETVPVMADLRRFGRPFVHSVLEPDDSVFEMETGPGTQAWTDIEDISPFLVHAVLAHEDARFFSHGGFSMHHIRDALVKNLQEHRYVVGASTITMQLVKNVFLHREKTLARKIQEVLLTWWLERVMDKRDIIELYLNVIEYGPHIYGIRAAAEHYFSRTPAELSPAESVWFANILPAPKKFHQQLVRGTISKTWAEMMRKMLIRLRDRGSYAPESVEYGLRELEHFRFAPEGTAVQPREIPGGAAPLPYMPGGGADAPWANDDSTLGDGDAPDEDLEAARPASRGAAQRAVQ